MYITQPFIKIGKMKIIKKRRTIQLLYRPLKIFTFRKKREVT